MLNRIPIIMKASFLEVRLYWLIFLGLLVASLIPQVIVNLALGDNTLVSIGNMLTTFLLVIAVVLPTSFFRRVINLGATRKQYYLGVLTIYVLWSAGYAVFNILWLILEKSSLTGSLDAFNILQVFHWDQFGVVGMFIYQFCIYMMLISLLNLLFSGLRHFASWIMWAVLIAAVPIGVSIPAYRVHVAEAFQVLLVNDSLLVGTGLAFIFSCVFLAGGWLFIRRRTV